MSLVTIKAVIQFLRFANLQLHCQTQDVVLYVQETYIILSTYIRHKHNAFMNGVV